MSTAISRHGAFLYDLSSVIPRFGSPDLLAAAMESCEMTHAWLRVHGRTAAYGSRQRNLDVIAALQARGIAVAGWGWCQGDDPAREADLAVQSLHDLGLRDYVADIEQGVNAAHWTAAEVTAFLSRVRSNLAAGARLVVSTFGLIDWHAPELMSVADPLVDAFAPQVYWFEHPSQAMRQQFGSQYARGEPAAYADLCLDRWSRLTTKPIVLTGQAYWGEGIGRDRAEEKLDRFLATFTGWSRLAGVNWWNFGTGSSMSARMISTIRDAHLGVRLAASSGGGTPLAAPVGSPTAASPASSRGTYLVTVDGLNLRSEPRVRAGNVLTVLRRGQAVEWITASPDPAWWQVQLVHAGARLAGYTAHRFLSPAAAPALVGEVTGIGEAHLSRTNGNAKRSSRSGHAFPLFEPGQPFRDPGATSAQKATQLTTIVDWLDVEQSARYEPRSSTYCNIYAHDYCYLARVYLPRVWWTSRAITDLAAGIPVTPIYDRTVQELNANALFQWLSDYGPSFGWAYSPDLVVEPGRLQDAANGGQVVVICAPNRDSSRSGHICVVVPETPQHQADRQGGRVLRPLQSQAGRENFKYRTHAWWNGPTFRDRGGWIHP